MIVSVSDELRLLKQVQFFPQRLIPHGEQPPLVPGLLLPALEGLAMLNGLVSTICLEARAELAMEGIKSLRVA